MNTRTRNMTVVFSRPFTLDGLDGVQPAGTYDVELYDELLDTLTSPAYRRISTSIELHGMPAGISRRATVDHRQLEDALARDAATAGGSLAYSGPPLDLETQHRTGNLRASVGGGVATVDHETRWESHGVVTDRAAMPAADRAFGGWSRWIALNANELTWIGLIAGAFILGNFLR